MSFWIKRFKANSTNPRCWKRKPGACWLIRSRSSLATNFAGQWLYLRELKSARPEAPEFNDNLRQAFRTETEMLFESILREDRSVTDLLNADYTFVNETSGEVLRHSQCSRKPLPSRPGDR